MVKMFVSTCKWSGFLTPPSSTGYNSTGLREVVLSTEREGEEGTEYSILPILFLNLVSYKCISVLMILGLWRRWVCFLGLFMLALLTIGLESFLFEACH